MPDYLIPLGRTVGLRRQRRGLQPRRLPGRRRRRPAPRAAPGRLRRRPRPRAAGAAGRLERGARRRRARSSAPSTPTRPRRSPTTSPRALGARRVFNRLSARIAVSEAAAWTGRRWFGGHYEIDPQRRRRRRRARAARSRPSEELRVALRRPPRGAQGPADPAHRLRRPGRARALPADRDRRRARGRRCATSPTPRRCAAIDVRGRVSGERALAARCTRPTCSARPRSPARASAWS